MNRRQYLSGITGAVAVALAGCSELGLTTQSRSTATSTPTATPGPTPSEPTSPTTAVQSSGADSFSFSTNGGLAIVTVVVSGGSQITVSLQSDAESMTIAESMTNGRTLWTGTLSAGDWTVDVDADTDWKIEIVTPSTGNVTAPTGHTSSGVGVDWFPLEMTGDTTATATFVPRSDTDSFTVTAYRPDGAELGILYDTKSELQNEQTTVSHTGTGWITVEATAQYSLAIGS